MRKIYRNLLDVAYLATLTVGTFLPIYDKVKEEQREVIPARVASDCDLELLSNKFSINPLTEPRHVHFQEYLSQFPTEEQRDSAIANARYFHCPGQGWEKPQSRILLTE